MNKIELSSLPHTWIFDLDGTIVQHNGHLSGDDILLPGVTEFWANIPAEDFIIIISARDEGYHTVTSLFLESCGLRYDLLLLGVPKGERILINDKKPSGMLTAHAINIERDTGLGNAEWSVSQDI